MLDALLDVFSEKMIFCRLFELKIVCFAENEITLSFPNQAQWGRGGQQNGLHSGAIATTIAAAAELLAITLAVDPSSKDIKNDLLKQFEQTYNIDMRIDYISPSAGELFFVQAHLLRKSNQFITTHMQLRNEKETLIAIGAGTYAIAR